MTRYLPIYHLIISLYTIYHLIISRYTISFYLTIHPTTGVWQLMCTPWIHPTTGVWQLICTPWIHPTTGVGNLYAHLGTPNDWSMATYMHTLDTPNYWVWKHAHLRYTQEWDVKIIKDIAARNSQKSVLSYLSYTKSLQGWLLRISACRCSARRPLLWKT